MSNTDSHPFRPDYAIPPGETLRDLLAEMNVSQAELAARAGLSTKHVNQIVQGNAPITLETAIVLDRITGIPAEHMESPRGRLPRRTHARQASSPDRRRREMALLIANPRTAKTWPAP